MYGDADAGNIDVVDEEQELVLKVYVAKGSSCSQKVLLALNEKKLAYEIHVVDIFKGENLMPWFLDMNPKGEVPVLVHKDSVVCDSATILNYLEEHFITLITEIPSLVPEILPEDQVATLLMKKMLNEIALPLLTFGSVRFPELTSNAKISKAELKNRLDGLKNRPKLFDEFAQKYPAYAEIYMAKKVEFEKFQKNFGDIDTFSIALDQLEAKMDFFENQLSLNEDPERHQWWLGTRNFSLIDVLMAVLLHRLEHLGLSDRYFSGGKRPNILKYYKRLQIRDSFMYTFVDEDSADGIPWPIYCALFVVLGGIVFAITAACAHVKNH